LGLEKLEAEDGMNKQFFQEQEGVPFIKTKGRTLLRANQAEWTQARRLAVLLKRSDLALYFYHEYLFICRSTVASLVEDLIHKDVHRFNVPLVLEELKVAGATFQQVFKAIRGISNLPNLPMLADSCGILFERTEKHKGRYSLIFGIKNEYYELERGLWIDDTADFMWMDMNRVDEFALIHRLLSVSEIIDRDAEMLGKLVRSKRNIDNLFLFPLEQSAEPLKQEGSTMPNLPKKQLKAKLSKKQQEEMEIGASDLLYTFNKMKEESELVGIPELDAFAVLHNREEAKYNILFKAGSKYYQFKNWIDDNDQEAYPYTGHPLYKDEQLNEIGLLLAVFGFSEIRDINLEVLGGLMEATEDPKGHTFFPIDKT
jgi:hypothetical protein